MVCRWTSFGWAALPISLFIRTVVVLESAHTEVGLLLHFDDVSQGKAKIHIGPWKIGVALFFDEVEKNGVW